VSLATEVGRILRQKRIALQRSPLANAASSANQKAAAHQPSVVVQKKTLDWKTQQKQLDDMFEQQSKTQLSNLPEITMPEALQTELFGHQVDGIRWMVHRETGNIEPPFYKKVKEQGKTMYLSEITNASQSEPPKGIAGGILAECVF
jgi:phage protein D